MEALYQETINLISETQGHIQQLSSCIDENEPILKARVNESLMQLQSDYDRLKILLNKEPVEKRRQVKSRVDQVGVDIRSLQNSLHMYERHKQQKEDDMRARNELLGQRYTNNNDSQTAIPMESSLRGENERLSEANKGMDQLLANASSIFGGLQNQHSILKGVQRRMLDIANTLGLSNTVMRLIERRTAQDWYIFIGGVIITLFVIYVVLRYFL